MSLLCGSVDSNRGEMKSAVTCVNSTILKGNIAMLIDFYKNVLLVDIYIFFKYEI